MDIGTCVAAVFDYKEFGSEDMPTMDQVTTLTEKLGYPPVAEYFPLIGRPAVQVLFKRRK